MGVMESEQRRRRHVSKIQQAMLSSVAAVGIISIALVAPNAIKILELIHPDLKDKKRRAYSTNRSFWKLVENGYIRIDETEHGAFARITEKGTRVLSTIRRAVYTTPTRPKRWDKKWRVLIFDIKENKRRVRDNLRSTLRTIGFIRLQQSVWVYPYDCEDFVTLLKADLKLGNEMLYMIVDQIEHDEKLRVHFVLPRDNRSK